MCLTCTNSEHDVIPFTLLLTCMEAICIMSKRTKKNEQHTQSKCRTHPVETEHSVEHLEASLKDAQTNPAIELAFKERFFSRATIH